MKKILIANSSIFFIFSLFFTIYFLGFDNLWFNKTNWLYGAGDLTNAQLSWQYFKNDIWRFPIGRNPNYGLEIANSIVFTDNIPLLAIFFKILNPIIYEKFQYFGLWIFLCFFLQLTIGYNLVKKISQNKIFSFISSFLFLLCPFLLFRLTHHFALGAQWLILYAFYISYFIPPDKKNIHWILIIFLSLLIHLYFTVIIFLIYLCFSIENIFKKNNLKDELLSLFYKIIFALITMYVVGYFESSPINAVSNGYGIFKIDLMSFFDPQLEGRKTWSVFLNDINGTNFEGFTYMGLGNIFLVIFAFFIFLKIKLQRELITQNFNIFRLGNIFVIFFLIWSVTTNVSFMGKEIINIDLPKYIFALLSIFGSTGRFAWPVIYVLIFFSILIIYKNTSKSLSIPLISIILFIQIFDISVGVKNHKITKVHGAMVGGNDPIWKVIEKDFDIIRTTYLYNNYGPIFSKFSKIIGNIDSLKTDIILNAAMDRQKAAAVRYSLIKKINNNNLPNDTAYLIDNLGHLKQLKMQFSKQNYGFFNRDDFWIMLPKKKLLMNKNDISELNKIKIDKIVLNQKYNLNFRDKFLGFGWSHNHNKKGVWSEGSNSYLLLNGSNIEENNLEMDLSLTPYKGNKREDFKVKIFINNKLNKTINLNNKKNITQAKIKFKNDKKNNEIKIHFEFSGLISPYDIFESPDARKLGVLLTSFIIKEKI